MDVLLDRPAITLFDQCYTTPFDNIQAIRVYDSLLKVEMLNVNNANLGYGNQKREKEDIDVINCYADVNMFYVCP